MEGVAFALFFFLTVLIGWWDRALVGDLNSSFLSPLVLFCYVLSVIKDDISNNSNNKPQYLDTMLF